MHSPALALAWQLWGRHRRGLAAVATYCVAVPIAFNLLPAGTVDSRYGAVFSMQFVIALIYVAAVFAYGFECQLESRESGFPARLFTLPVRTGLLVSWPMLQGMAAVALLWAAWASFVLRPAGIDVSLGSTTLLAVAFVAVLQALLWSPFGLPWVRVALAVVVLPLLAVAPLLGPALGIEEPVLTVLYAALIPLAALTAFAGVSRARHGAAPDWQSLLRPLGAVVRRPLWRAAPFPSAARAQLWFERRRHLPPFLLAVGGFAALHLAFILRLAGPLRSVDYKAILGLNFFFFPPLLAPFFGCFLGRTGTAAGHPYPLSPFTAARPVRDTALVAAKLQVAALATLGAWAAVLLADAVWFVYSGSDVKVRQTWDSLYQTSPTWRFAATVVLAVVGPLLLTWRLLVDNLWIGLAGRPWLVRTCLLACGAAVPVVGMLLAHTADDADFRHWAWETLPWWAGAAAALKLLAAALVGRAFLRQNLLGKRALAKVLAVWLLAAVGLFVLAYGAVPDGAAPVSLLASGAVLGVPLVRVAAAPLALAWNRHR
jgi:hypothetical protein